jgi:hypothetical protein
MTSLLYRSLISIICSPVSSTGAFAICRTGTLRGSLNAAVRLFLHGYNPCVATICRDRSPIKVPVLITASV